MFITFNAYVRLTARFYSKKDTPVAQVIEDYNFVLTLCAFVDAFIVMVIFWYFGIFEKLAGK